MKYIIGLILLFIVQIGFAQEEEFPYTERAWATYFEATDLFVNGDLFFGFKIENRPTYEINPFDFLQEYIINPDNPGDSYFGKLTKDQEVDFVKIYGTPWPIDTTIGRLSAGPRAVDVDENLYFVGHTHSEVNIGTPGAYQEYFNGNWSDPYEVYFPQIDSTLTMPPNCVRMP